MTYSTEPRFRKYVEGYGFLSCSRKFGDEYGKKLMVAATKTRIDAAKTDSKRVVQNIAETTGDLIGNKIANKINSIGKKRKGKKKRKKQRKQKKFTFHHKKYKLLMTLNYFEHKM